MARRAKAVVVGAVVLVAAGACGGDASKPPSDNSAGSGADAGQAGVPNEPDPGSSGASAGQATAGAASAGAGAGAAAAGEGGAAVEAATDVSGQVMAGAEPFAGAIVVVDEVVKIADAEGRFRVRNVAAHYQLMIRDPQTKRAYVYQGLKTREPRVNLGQGLTSDLRIATVRGKLLGGGFADPLSPDANKQVSYVSEQPGATDQDFQDPVDSFEVQPQWLGGADDEGELWGLQYLSDFDRGAYEYVGFGQRKISVTDQAVIGSVDGDATTDITLTDPVDLPLETHTILPVGWDLDFGSQVYVGPLHMRVEVALGDGSLVVPKLDVPVLIETAASGDDGYSVVVDAPPAKGSTLDIVHSKPARLTSPDANATGITSSSEFFWEEAPDASVASVTIVVGDWTIFVTTAEGSLKFPDLTPLKVRIPGQIAGSWQVSSSGPAATVEEAMARDEQLAGGAKLAGFMSVGNPRDFVTGQ